MSAITTMLADKGFENQLAGRVADNMKVERFLRMFATSVYKTPKLLQCTPDSIKIAAYNLAELNLSPIAAHGQAYLIPYYDRKNNKTDCQLQIGWRGLVAMALRDGAVRSINAELVYQGENFKCMKGSHAYLDHEIDFFNPVDRSFKNLVGGYAIAELKDGGRVFEVMSIQQLLAHKEKWGKPGAWDSAPEEMMRKTLVKRLCKYLPVSDNHSLLQAIEIDNEAIEMKNTTPENKAENVVDSIKNDLLDHDTIVEDFFNEEVISHEKIMENPDKFAVIKETGEIITIDKAIKITLEEQINAYIMIINESKTLPDLDETYKKYYKILTKTAGLEQRHFKSLTDAADLHKAKLQELI